MALLKSIKKITETGGEFSPKAALDAIYRLEQVDVKSIRKLGVDTPVKEPLVFREVVPTKTTKVWDLGLIPEGKSSINAFILEEPIHVLGLSPHVDRILNQMNITLLHDLMNLDFSSLVHVKGMGQGHIEEIREKLNSYIGGRALKGCLQIDFESWVKSLLPESEKKRTYLLLDLYDLSHLVSLTPPESVEIRRLSPENKADWLEEGKGAFSTCDRRRLFEMRFKEIADVFLKPWMLKRHGFVRKEELMERLERLSLCKDTFMRSYKFFREIFFGGACPIEKLLLHRESLFFANNHCVQSFQRVLRVIDTYFYNSSVSYPLSQLVRLIESEFAMYWIGFPEGFVEKVIRYSPKLNVTREKELIVRIK